MKTTTKTTARPMKYKVLRGMHVNSGRVWKKDTIIETKSNLIRFNNPDGPAKYELMDDAVKASPGISMNEFMIGEENENEEETVIAVEEKEEVKESSKSAYDRSELQDLKVKDLESIAEEQGVDLSEVTRSLRFRKQKLIDAILGE